MIFVFPRFINNISRSESHHGAPSLGRKTNQVEFDFFFVVVVVFFFRLSSSLLFKWRDWPLSQTTRRKRELLEQVENENKSNALRLGERVMIVAIRQYFVFIIFKKIKLNRFNWITTFWRNRIVNLSF